MAIEEHCEDEASLRPLLALAALLNAESAPSPQDALPALGHWLYFHPSTRQSELREDGHPRATSLLPSDLPPRRMWAGSRIRFLSPISVGCQMQRRTVLKGVVNKAGRSGPLVFVALQHILTVGDVPALIEDQDIVYREAAVIASDPAEAPKSDVGRSDSSREVILETTALFRYSALTYNAHRIHYDRDYATKVEFYDGLVVQGPFLATLLIDHFRRQEPDLPINHFSFRARRPVFAERPIHLCLRRHRDGALLWAETEGAVAVTASVNAASEAGG